MSAEEQSTPPPTKVRFLSGDPSVQERARALGWDLQLPAVKYGVYLFTKGSKRVWEHLSGSTCAEIVSGTRDTSGRYENHRQYPTLLEALERESGKRKERRGAAA